MKSYCPSHRPGFTLLEVILATALAAFLVVAVGGAIQFYLRHVSNSQTEVEQVQLARAIMRLIESDLRSAVWKNQIDFESVEALASESAAGQLGDLAMEAGIDPSLAGSALDSSTTNIASSTMLPAAIGLYGNATELQLDISRVPRVDEYDPQYTGFRNRELGDLPSDIKTVAYFLLVPGMRMTGHGQIGSGEQNQPQFGLVRRELDRAVTQYALNEGNIEGLDASAEVLAPEVSMLIFRYFDGYEWYEEWDSEVLGGLPLAVDVILAIRDYETTQALLNEEPVDEPTNTNTEISNPALGKVYRRLVRIPIAQPIEEETDTLNSPAAEEVPL